MQFVLEDHSPTPEESLDNFLTSRSPGESDNSSASLEIRHILGTLKVLCHVHKRPPLDPCYMNHLIFLDFIGDYRLRNSIRHSLLHASRVSYTHSQ